MPGIRKKCKKIMERGGFYRKIVKKLTHLAWVLLLITIVEYVEVRKMVGLEEMEALLDEKVRPSLNAHGGDVVIKSLEDGVLKVKMIGKCSGCPSAHETNEEIIAAEVKEAFPEIEDVILVEEVSEEMLDFARKILNH